MPKPIVKSSQFPSDLDRFLGDAPLVGAQDPLNLLREGGRVDSMAMSGGIAMADLLLLSEAQMRRNRAVFSAVARDCDG